MKNKKKVIIVVAAVICVALLTALYFWNYNREKRYDCSEKNAVAMGTIVSQKLYGEGSAKHIEKISTLINALDDEISWREESSAVAKINSGEAVKSRQVTDIIEKCLQVTKDSDGVFDITIGGVTRLWNIGEDSQRVPTKKEIDSELQNVGSDKVSINSNTISVQDGTKLDLGAVGKGAACDNVMTYLKASDIKGAVVSVGGSIVACGKYNKKGDKWRIAIKHPRNENEYLGVISISEGFVSTSGDYERYFEHDGKRYHHIIDATSGYPADSGIISVTVVCDSGILSDALSTACFILGEQKSKSLLEKYNASAIFVDSELNVSVVGDIDFEY